eukprot:Sspe_Gene.93675::Locus_66231_Transcript_1_1_Confidence_1.000_Length_423::g.93675::m.93675
MLSIVEAAQDSLIKANAGERHTSDKAVASRKIDGIVPAEYKPGGEHFSPDRRNSTATTRVHAEFRNKLLHRFYTRQRDLRKLSQMLSPPSEWLDSRTKLVMLNPVFVPVLGKV